MKDSIDFNCKLKKDIYVCIANKTISNLEINDLKIFPIPSGYWVEVGTILC